VAGYSVYATVQSLHASSDLERVVEKERLPVRVFAMEVDSDASVKETIASIQSQCGVSVDWKSSATD
jgi:hypothetical protein